MSDIEERIGLAYSKMGIREPFIAAVLAKVKREITTTIPTAATNGSVVKYNPDFCAKWSDEQLFGLALHESCHVVLMHSWRRDGRDPSLWNIACDAIINQYIKSRGYELPDGGVHIGWVTEAMDGEAVYNRLKQEQQQQQGGGKGKGKGKGGAGQKSNAQASGKGDGDDQPGAGGWDGSGDLEDAVDHATATDMEATIATAAQMARECGHGSSLIDRVLGKLGQHKVSWQEYVRAMLVSQSNADYTYMRPSRRFIASGLYMPSLYSEAMGGLAIGFDTSGSMGPREADRIAEEIQGIINDLNPEFVEVVYCDYDVTKVELFDRDDDLVLRPKGGGGTRFQPVFKHLQETGKRYCGLVYFSDMMGDLDECEEPEFPVLWADIGDAHPPVPFGTRVEVPL